MHFESRTMIYIIVKNGPSEEPVVRKQFTFVSRLKKIVKYLMHEEYRVVDSEMNVYDSIHLEFANGCHIYDDYSDLQVRFPDLCLLRRRKASSRHCGRARRLHRLLHLQSAALQELQMGQIHEVLLQKIRSVPHPFSWGKHCNCICQKQKNKNKALLNRLS